jgi:chemotaxis protein CheC
MQLDQNEIDALSELVNIGFGRAASALSTLVGRRVLLEAPQVSIYPVEELTNTLNELHNHKITNVHQVFRGRLAGDALLLMDTPSASILVDLLGGGTGKQHELTQSDHETLVETGNIILNAFIGSFGNLLRVHLTFTVPRLKIQTLPEMLDNLSKDGRGLEYALVVKIHFRLSRGDVSGYMLIVMGIQSMENIFIAMREEGYLQ